MTEVVSSPIVRPSPPRPEPAVETPPVVDAPLPPGIEGVRVALERAQTRGYGAYGRALAALAQARGSVADEALAPLAAALSPEGRGDAAGSAAAAADRAEDAWKRAWLTPAEWLALSSRFDLLWTPEVQASFRTAYRTAYTRDRSAP